MASSSGKINEEVTNLDDAFEDYLRRAFQTSQDGFIDYKDYCFFFQASNLPKHIVGQIWLVVNRKKPEEEEGIVIGREEFLEALQFASVAQRYQKEDRLYIFEQKVLDLEVYGEEVLLHKFDLPNVPPPNIDIFSDRTPWEITFTPERPKNLCFFYFEPVTEAKKFVQTDFELYIRIGGDSINSFPAFGGKGFDRCTIHIPAECEPVQKMVYIPPLGSDIIRGTDYWKGWEDVHEKVKAIVRREIPSLPIPIPPKRSPMEKERLREEKRLREEEKLKEDEIFQERRREDWLRTQQKNLGFL